MRWGGIRLSMYSISNVSSCAARRKYVFVIIRHHIHLADAMLGTPLPDACPYEPSSNEEVKRDWLWEGENFIYELRELVPPPCRGNHVLLCRQYMRRVCCEHSGVGSDLHAEILQSES